MRRTTDELRTAGFALTAVSENWLFAAYRPEIYIVRPANTATGSGRRAAKDTGQSGRSTRQGFRLAPMHGVTDQACSPLHLDNIFLNKRLEAF